MRRGTVLAYHDCIDCIPRRPDCAAAWSHDASLRLEHGSGDIEDPNNISGMIISGDGGGFVPGKHRHTSQAMAAVLDRRNDEESDYPKGIASADTSAIVALSVTPGYYYCP